MVEEKTSQGTCLLASSTDTVEWCDISPIPEMTPVPYKSLQAIQKPIGDNQRIGVCSRFTSQKQATVWNRLLLENRRVFEPVRQLKGVGKKPCPSKNGFGSGGRTLCLKRLSFSQFVVLMSTKNCETASQDKGFSFQSQNHFWKDSFFQSPFIDILTYGHTDILTY